jgi:hypothetical protein
MNYYKTLGEKYNVDPIIFVGIHVVATPLFAAAVWWILHNIKKKRSLVIPAIVATVIFNSANIYLVIMGKNIPWWVYALLCLTTLFTGYFSFRNIRKKIIK